MGGGHTCEAASAVGMEAVLEAEEIQVAEEGVAGPPREGPQMSLKARRQSRQGRQACREYDPSQGVGADRTLVKPRRRWAGYILPCAEMMSLKHVTTSSAVNESYPQDWRYCA